MGDLDEVSELLEQIRRAAEIDAEAMYRVMDNNLMHSDRIIANLAALSSNRDANKLVSAIAEAVKEDPLS